VDAWVKTNYKDRKLDWEWHNVQAGFDKEAPFKLDECDRENWTEIWRPIMARRYGISSEEYDQMLDCMTKNATNFGSFEGAGWHKLWRRDYLGELPKQ
jgi:hypothetical protein